MKSGIENALSAKIGERVPYVSIITQVVAYSRRYISYSRRAERTLINKYYHRKRQCPSSIIQLAVKIASHHGNQKKKHRGGGGEEMA